MLMKNAQIDVNLQHVSKYTAKPLKNNFYDFIHYNYGLQAISKNIKL